MKNFICLPQREWAPSLQSTSPSPCNSTLGKVTPISLLPAAQLCLSFMYLLTIIIFCFYWFFSLFDYDDFFCFFKNKNNNLCKHTWIEMGKSCILNYYRGAYLSNHNFGQIIEDWQYPRSPLVMTVTVPTNLAQVNHNFDFQYYR